mmetsp:Transcript_13075/g.28357  ORF Transcript_13075/g.28357 Transcript_13075/m.28357 type:complete len:517 (-) Transcript_13075:109-1659(-)
MASESSSSVPVHHRDVALVEWYLTNPPAVSATLATTEQQPPRTPATCSSTGDSDDLQLAARIRIPHHMQFFANVVLDYGEFHVPSAEEERRFDDLQRIYYAKTNSDGKVSPCDNVTDMDNSTAGIDVPMMRLSPRMVLDPTHAVSPRRAALKRAVTEYLDTLAREAEDNLLQEVDGELKRVNDKRERERRRRKAKKKNKKAKDRVHREAVEGGDNDGEEDLESTGTVDGAYDDTAAPTSLNESSVSDMKNISDSSNEELQPASSAGSMNKAEPSNENSSPNEEEGERGDCAKTSKSKGEDVIAADKSSEKPRKVSYLAMAAKVPNSSKTMAVSSNRSVPPPSTRILALDLPSPSAKKSSPSQQNVSEEEEIARLEQQLITQRRNHLELIQQVQLRAFIAETKATAALDRSRELERQILDATYPDVEATRVEAAAADATGGGAVSGVLSPRNGCGGPRTKEGLEHELRSQRREQLAMMQRVQMRTYLAETKAKAAEERSKQLEELRRDAKEGNERFT